MSTQQWIDRVNKYWRGFAPVVGKSTGFHSESCVSCGGGYGERYNVTFKANPCREPSQGNVNVCIDCANYISSAQTPDLD